MSLSQGNYTFKNVNAALWLRLYMPQSQDIQSYGSHSTQNILIAHRLRSNHQTQ